MYPQYCLPCKVRANIIKFAWMSILQFTSWKFDRNASFRDTCVIIRIRYRISLMNSLMKKSVDRRDPEQPLDAGKVFIKLSDQWTDFVRHNTRPISFIRYMTHYHFEWNIRNILIIINNILTIKIYIIIFPCKFFSFWIFFVFQTCK